MGWSNMFININKDSGDYVSIERIEEFINHHNNYTEFFNEDQLKKMDETDELPGEELELKVLIQQVNDKNYYWAYLGNHGGCGHTFEWKDKYFPDIKMFHSGDFVHYNDGWIKWPLLTVVEYKENKFPE